MSKKKIVSAGLTALMLGTQVAPVVAAKDVKAPVIGLTATKDGGKVTLNEGATVTVSYLKGGKVLANAFANKKLAKGTFSWAKKIGAGSWTVKVTAKDAAGNTAVKTYAVNVAAPVVKPVVSNATVTVAGDDATVGFNLNVAAKATVEVYVFGNLPMVAQVEGVAGSNSAKITLDKAIKNGTYNVKVKAGDSVADATLTLNRVSDVAGVESVTALNATQVQVKFNQEVDKAAAETATNYLIDVNSPTSAALGTDKKTVTLTFAAAAHVEVTSKVLVVKPVTLVADALKSTAIYTSVFTSKDTVKPEIVSVESKTAGATASTVTIKASEPVASAVVKIDGAAVATVIADNTITVSGLSLDATKSHTLEVINLTDGATVANVTTLTTKTFTPVVDTVKPTVTLSADGDKTILLTFSKPMNAGTVTSALQAADTVLKDEALANVNYTDATAVAGTDDKQFKIAISDALYTNKTSRTLYVVLPSTIADSLGNTLVGSTASVTLTKDTAKPVATGFKVVKNGAGNVTDLVVTFSEGLAAAAGGAVANPTIVDSNGVLVAAFLGGLTSDAVNAGDKQVTYSVGVPAKPTSNYTFTFAGSLVTDNSEVANASDAFTYNYDFGAAAPGATTFTLSSVNDNAGSNVIDVDFGTAVVGGNVANSATALTSYTLNGKALPAGTTITLDGTRNVATITLPANSVKVTDAAAVLTVNSVKSTTGATVNPYVGVVTVTDNTNPILTAAQVIGDTIVLTFDEALGAGAADANIAAVLANYKITSNGTTVVAGAGVATASIVAGSGDKKVQIVFTDTTGTNFVNTQTIVVETKAGNDVADTATNAAKAAVAVTATR